MSRITLEVVNGEGWVERFIALSGPMRAGVIGSSIFLRFVAGLIQMVEYLVEIVSNDVLEDLHFITYFGQSHNLGYSIIL